jgi:hypothetical protein
LQARLVPVSSYDKQAKSYLNCPALCTGACTNLLKTLVLLHSKKALSSQIDTTMKRVILESPYAGDIEKNIEYGRACLRDSIMRGEAPIASHLLLTQPTVLDDSNPAERKVGIEAGLAWCEVSDGTVVYEDYGISKGMQFGIDKATTSGKPIEYRRILPQ